MQVMTAMGRWLGRPLLVVTLLLVTGRIHAFQASSETLTIDASHAIGTIKRVNDVDNGPLCEHGLVDLSRNYKELGIRNVRLHDAPLTYDNVLDINYVFPDWNANPDRPESYRFTQSDFYLKSITDLDINIIFRLGYSAEGKTQVRHNTPPPDFSKWADVAAHIVRHYNKGWDNGPHANIKYWEIWNEPDGHEFWSGSLDQYNHLYEITAQKLKAVDPSLKVGGPAIAGSMVFLDGFLKYTRNHHVPVDFVSWHIYTRRPDDIARRAHDVHALMEEDGYHNEESILDEWNYGPSNWQKLFADAVATRSYFDSTQNAAGAAFDVAVLIGLQDAPVDIATYYTGTTLMWGMFTSSGAPQKPYYAFLAFQRMLNSPRRVAVRGSGSPLRTLAGISQDGHTLRILISNFSRESRTAEIDLAGLPWTGPARCKQQIIDNRHDLENVEGAGAMISSHLTERIGADSVVLLTITPASR